MLIYIKLCTHIGRIDGEVAEIPRMPQLSQFILENSLYIISWQFLRIWNRNVDITRFLRVLLPRGKLYAQNTRLTTRYYWQTDWPWSLRYRITSKNSTDTFIEQVQFTDSSEKARRKRIVYRYVLMNNPMDFQPTLWVTKPFSTWPSTHPFSDKASSSCHLLCIRE
jgi:hypothetical protein